MALSQTIYQSALNGARISRYGDAVMVVMQSYSFMTTSQDMQMASQWARSKQSQGNKQNDCTAFTNRFETMIGRQGGGIATKGANKVLAQIVAIMKGNGMDTKEWLLPHNINESMEAKPMKAAPVIVPLEPAA